MRGGGRASGELQMNRSTLPPQIVEMLFYDRVALVEQIGDSIVEDEGGRAYRGPRGRTGPAPWPAGFVEFPRFRLAGREAEDSGKGMSCRLVLQLAD